MVISSAATRPGQSRWKRWRHTWLTCAWRCRRWRNDWLTWRN